MIKYYYWELDFNIIIIFYYYFITDFNLLDHQILKAATFRLRFVLYPGGDIPWLQPVSVQRKRKLGTNHTSIEINCCDKEENYWTMIDYIVSIAHWFCYWIVNVCE